MSYRFRFDCPTCGDQTANPHAFEVGCNDDVAWWTVRCQVCHELIGRNIPAATVPLLISAGAACYD